MPRPDSACSNFSVEHMLPGKDAPTIPSAKSVLLAYDPAVAQERAASQRGVNRDSTREEHHRHPWLRHDEPGDDLSRDCAGNIVCTLCVGNVAIQVSLILDATRRSYTRADGGTNACDQQECRMGRQKAGGMMVTRRARPSQVEHIASHHVRDKMQLIASRI